MIYWFIGQPGCGKTTLAKMWTRYLCDEACRPTIHLDGDDLRKVFGNAYKPKHFTKKYRNDNTRQLQRFVEHIHKQDVSVVVSTVNPTRNVREELKKRNSSVIEIYVVNSGKHVRDKYAVSDFEPPLENFFLIDTNGLTPAESYAKLYASNL